MSRENRVWLATLAIWALGAILIYLAWNFHFPNDLIDSIWGFVLYIVAFGYVMAIMPIKEFVERRVLPGPPV